MIKLASEFVATMDGLDERAAAWLKRQGVPTIALFGSPGPVGVAGIETHPIGMFDFCNDGRRAYILPVLSGPQYSDLLDLLAWYPDQPGRWWSRSYTGVPLGVDALDRAEIGQTALMLHRTPLGWLAAGGEGICVTCWAMSLQSLCAVPTLVCEDAEHGREVSDRLSQPLHQIPQIRVMFKEAA